MLGLSEYVLKLAHEVRDKYCRLSYRTWEMAFKDYTNIMPLKIVNMADEIDEIDLNIQMVMKMIPSPYWNPNFGGKSSEEGEKLQSCLGDRRILPIMNFILTDYFGTPGGEPTMMWRDDFYEKMICQTIRPTVPAEVEPNTLINSPIPTNVTQAQQEEVYRQSRHLSLGSLPSQRDHLGTQPTDISDYPTDDDTRVRHRETPVRQYSDSE
jgi:hypothetical protein